MKKLFFYISILTAIVLTGIIIPHVYALSSSSAINIAVSTDDGCEWSGTPWLSDLTVPDNEICVIQGTGRTAVNVTVEADLDSAGQAGGLLIVGSDNTDTDFTLSGHMNIYGMAEVGIGGTSYNSQLIINSGNLSIGDSSGDTASMTVRANGLGDNSISVNNYIYIGNSSNSNATLEIKDGGILTNSTGYIANYGTFNNLAGQMDVTTTIFSYNNSTIDNDATININGSLRLNNSSNIDNSGTITTGIVYEGIAAGDTPSITNSGTFNLLASNYLQMNYGSTFTNTNTGSLSIPSSSLQVLDTSTFTNDGTVTTQYLYIGYDNGSKEGGTVTNQGSGTLTVTGSGNSLQIYKGTLTNNNTGTGISLDIAGNILIRGTDPATGGESGILNNYGVVQHNGDLTAREYSQLNLKSGTNSWWVAPSSRYYTFTTTSSTQDYGTLNIESGAIYSVFFTYIGQNDGSSSFNNNGKLVNHGTIERINISTGNPTSEPVYFYTYNDSIINNYGTIDMVNGELRMYDHSVFTNRSTGTITNTGSGYIYGDSTGDSVFDNYGEATFHNLGVGYQGTDGGIFNNYAVTGFGVNFTNTGTLSIHNGGVFNNLTDAEASIYSINLGFGTGTTSEYIQAERTTNTNTKTTMTGNMQINNYGHVETEDLMSIADMSIDITDSYFHQNAGTTASNSVTNSTGYITLNGELQTAVGTTFNNSQTTFVNATGHIINDGTYNSTNTGSMPFRVSGIVESDTNSHFTFSGTPGLKMEFNSSHRPSVEIAGTIINNDARLYMDNGELCLGHWSAGPGSTCSNSLKTLTLGDITLNAYDSSSDTDLLIATTDVDVQGNISMTSGTDSRTTDLLQYPSSHLQVTNNGHIDLSDANTTLTSNGELDIQGSGEGNHGYLQVNNAATANLNYTSADYDIGSISMLSAWSGDTTINLATGATLNLNDYESCSGTHCAINLNLNSYSAPSIFNIYGDVNISSASGDPRTIYLGYTGTTYGTGEMIVHSGGQLQNTTTGELMIQKAGRLYVEDDSNTDFDVDIAGHMKIYGKINDGTGDRGAYIGGQLECETVLEVNSTGWMDIGTNGVVTVAGSTTSVSGEMELDGTLNSGDLTVTSTGYIHSGDGNPLTTGPGTGPSTNFLINAHNVTVNASGKIASDGVSNLNNGPGAGSYGGEGEGDAGGGVTYGNSKLTEVDTPLYGEAGYSLAGPDAYGGGGVRISATGDIDIDGEVSADGADGSNSAGGSGAGGTVIIVQNPSLPTATFTGTGEITADGGNSATTGVPVGGGGRISIKSPLFDDPDYASYGFGTAGGTIHAYGGANSADSDYAAAGTIVYLGDENNDNTSLPVYGTLTVDQGGNATTSGEKTEIPNSGNIEFARIESKNAAQITFATDPTTDPITCYDNNNGSTVTFTSRNCRPNPDKPNVIYINDTYEGAQTRAETTSGGEPSVSNPISGLYDLTPAFSAVYQNVEDPTSSVNTILIQVDDTSDFSSPIWDTELPLNTPITNGQRSEDIYYDQDSSALATLVVGTTYYVRMAFKDTTNTYQGLWSHRDIGDYYNYDIDGSMTITDSCAGTIVIQDDVPDGDGGPLSDSTDNRYGNGSCDLSVTSTYGYWRLLFGKAPGETAFDDDTSATYDIDETTDYNIVTDGGASSDEEYGYNIDASASPVLQNHVQTDSESSQDFDTWSQATGNYIFDVEDSGSEDEIIRVDDNNTATNEKLILNMHASVDSTTEVENYSLGTWMIITTNP